MKVGGDGRRKFQVKKQVERGHEVRKTGLTELKEVQVCVAQRQSWDNVCVEVGRRQEPMVAYSLSHG